MIDPNIWQSEDVSKLSVFDRLLFIGLFSNADDEGRGRANPALLRATVFPYDEIRVADIAKSLSNIGRHTSVILYESNGNQYYAFQNWDKWQRVDKPLKSVIPPPVESDSGVTPELLSTCSGVTPEPFSPKRKEKKLREDKLKEVNSCAEQECSTQQEQPTPPVISLILNDKTEYPISQEQVDKWADLYPAVNVIQQLRNMKGWLDSNQQKRKTRAGILRFVTGWLSRAQNKGGDIQVSYSGKSPPPNYSDPRRYENQRTDDFFGEGDENK
jgi:hypothetical protein